MREQNYYPWYDNPEFEKIIYQKKEYRDNAINSRRYKDRVLNNYQYMASNYLNPKSPYRSLLLYYSTGVGKTLSAISTAENFIRDDPEFKIVVITKNTSIENSFKQQLIKIYPGFLKEYEKNKAEQKVKRNYSFIHFEAFKNQVLGIKERNFFENRRQGVLHSIDNSLVIVDEAHNIIGNKGYKALLSVLVNSKNIRLLLLSATPVYDKLEEVFEVSNILNFDRPLYQFNLNNLPGEGLIQRTGILDNISIFKDENLFKITEKGKKNIAKTLRHKVLYLKTDTSSFPKYYEMGQNLVYPLYDVSSKLKVILCPMSDYQERNYNHVVNNERIAMFFKNIEDASSIAYPEEINGDFRMLGKYLKYDVVGKYSAKLYSLIKNLKNAKGKVFIYSSLVNENGVSLIAKCLGINGFRYTTITSDIDNEVRNKRMMRFNSPDNINGEIIPIIIGSRVLAEGLTLKEVRQVHIYEPFWNLSGIDQVTGRAIRNNSHARLPPEERTVEIYKYCATGKNLMRSIDASKYIKAERKDMFIKEAERVIAKSSFACFLNKDRNMVRNHNDGTRECEYTKCNYTCNWEPRGNEAELPLDTFTYETRFHNIDYFLKILYAVKNLLKNNQVYSYSDLLDTINCFEIDLTNVLSYMVENHIIENKGIYYYIKKSTSRPNSDSKSSSSSSSSKSSSSKSRCNKTALNFKGFVKNGVFAIKTQKKLKGKVCSSYTKKELQDMVKKLGVKVKGNLNKTDLCLILESKLV